jgi:hypothetical protein
MHRESHYRRSDVVGWLAEQGVTLAVCQSECGRTYTRSAFKAMPGLGLRRLDLWMKIRNVRRISSLRPSSTA